MNTYNPVATSKMDVPDDYQKIVYSGANVRNAENVISLKAPKIYSRAIKKVKKRKWKKKN